MPLYDYACTNCGHTLEVRHGFDESYAQPCETCGAPVRRVFNAAPVLFKGSGFYVTDSRRSVAGSKSEKAKTDSAPPAEAGKVEAAKTEAPVPTAKESKPAEPAA